MKITESRSTFALLTLALATVSLDAHAYLDPGTGSAIIQGVIAALSAVLVAGHLYWTRLTLWFRSLRKDSRASADATQCPESQEDQEQPKP